MADPFSLEGFYALTIGGVVGVAVGIPATVASAYFVERIKRRSRESERAEPQLRVGPADEETSTRTERWPFIETAKRGARSILPLFAVGGMLAGFLSPDHTIHTFSFILPGDSGQASIDGNGPVRDYPPALGATGSAELLPELRPPWPVAFRRSGVYRITVTAWTPDAIIAEMAVRLYGTNCAAAATQFFSKADAPSSRHTEVSCLAEVEANQSYELIVESQGRDLTGRTVAAHHVNVRWRLDSPVP